MRLQASKGRYNILNPREESWSIHIKGLVGLPKDYVNISVYSSSDIFDRDYLFDYINTSYDVEVLEEMLKEICDNVHYISSDKTDTLFRKVVSEGKIKEVLNLTPLCEERKRSRILYLKERISEMQLELTKLEGYA